ncbi:MAG TPA: type IV toxin-antitoxin system AbiEi family antitoxin domain-containing protein [Agromyces sp.]|nr:type IV toxin-antitoxin system AbiEi family antitoxin domain-containing protein [Agromyces sp.]
MRVDTFLIQQGCTDLGGVVRTRDLTAGGVSRHSLATAVRRGDLIRLREGVYVHPDTSDDIRTAVLHGGVLGCLSRANEAGLWILEEPSTLHVALPKNGHFREYAHESQGDARKGDKGNGAAGSGGAGNGDVGKGNAGKRVAEDGATGEGCMCSLHWGDMRAHGGMQALPEALAAMLLCLGEEHFFVALESAMKKRLIDSPQLARLRTRISKKHRWLVEFARWNADSGLESLLRLRLRSLGLSLASQVKVPGVGLVDFVLGDRLIIEVDGKPNHVGVSERHKDLVRDVVAAAHGFDTLRFDYALVIHDWEIVEAAILAKVELGLHRRLRVSGRYQRRAVE